MKRLFAATEIDSSVELQHLYWALLAGFVLAFQTWSYQSPGVATSSNICPEYFQSCAPFLFPAPSLSHLYAFFQTILFSCLLASAVGAYKNRWDLARAFLIPPFLAKVVVLFGLTAQAPVPFEMFHLVPCAIWLFLRHKLSQLRLSFVLLYVISGFLKLDSGWIAGTLFSTWKTGLPFLPEAFIPVATNLVITAEVAAAWWLLSPVRSHSRWVVGFFVLFHVYSFALVGYRYPLLCLPLLLIPFTQANLGRLKVSAGGLVLMGALVLMNAAPWVIGPHPKLTFEGTALSLNMFDANRQTLSTLQIRKESGGVEMKKVGSANSFDRISPYHALASIQRMCREVGVKTVAWDMVMSVNGSPFKTVVKEPNACALKFQTYARNSWIQEDGAQVGYPEKNGYVFSNDLPRVFETPQIEPSPFVKALEEQTPWIAGAYGLSSLLSLAWLVTSRRRSMV